MADRGRGRGGRGRGDGGGFRGDGGGFRGGRGGSDRGGDSGGFRGGRGGFDRGGGGGGFRGGHGGLSRIYGDGKFPPPDAQVTKIENETVKDLSAAFAGTSLEAQLPRRPGYGTNGRPIVLWANYFDLKSTGKDTVLYRYSVTVQGATELPKPKKKRLIQLLLETSPFSDVVAASDWAQVIISTKKVALGGERRKFDIEWFPADGEKLPPAAADDTPNRVAARTRNTFSLLVEELEGTVSVQELMSDLTTSTSTYPLKLETIQALNIVLAQGPSTDPNIATASGNRYYPFGGPQHQVCDLGSGLQALRGYFSSVRTSVSRIIVNINVATGAFYKPGPLMNLLRELGGPPQTPDQHRKLNAFVRKLRFETNYLPERADDKGKVRKGKDGTPLKKRKVHVIGDLSPFKASSQTVKFDWTKPNGQSANVTVEQYFKQSYNITLASPAAPLVNYGTRESPKWIPAELCFVLPGQLAKRLLLGDQTRKMITFAARRPFENAESIMGDGLQVTKISPVSQGLNTHLTKFGIKVNPNLLTVHGRILPPPVLQYRAQTCTPSNGAWNLDTRQLGMNPFRVAKPLPLWNCLVINSGRDSIPGGPPAVKANLELFRKTLGTYGLNPGPVQNPAVVNLTFNDIQNKDIRKLQGLIDQALRQFKQKPKFLFVILPNDNALVYDCVKYVCDIKNGITNVCNIGSKFSKEKGQVQYFANVALKFNQKLGGVNHSIQLEKLKPLDPQTIVFGIDVTHPSPGSADSSPSIAGVVASVDQQFAQYPASMRTQEGRKEMVTELEEMIIERLRLWQKRNQGRLPTKVIVYRDGVSEGQYPIVMQAEYPAFVKAFEKLYGAVAKHPKISIIVVGKRHHTRFYPTKAEDSDQKTGNPQPGTVVDRGVTGEKLFDFFLLAHQGLQGTSKPAHYVVLKDDNKLGADQLQMLTHNLCYTFARATRAVSVCPPAYYADILCERGRSYLHGVLKGDGAVAFSNTEWQRDVHPDLAETMYYL
ncbi:Piwi domain-containing protein [Massariosphaeria phaeospora]|uniref:Piwi domain-containing protein n=1 Tax=Massariosphaeria phaeospora TaxID=100035 RepID=A0A7C8MBH5_9PLEO|nr:Piwi domain-containing protein [Massariosphaeria phaeospora]